MKEEQTPTKWEAEHMTFLKCPFCGDTKKILNLICADTYVKEWWSDSRVIRPYCPVIYPIQKCDDCGKYYFIQPEQHHVVDIDEHFDPLPYRQLLEVCDQFRDEELTVWQKEQLYLEILREYNRAFRQPDSPENLTPGEEDEKFFHDVLHWLLKHSEYVKTNDILYAELLREGGYFLAAENILKGVADEDYAWMVKPMLARIRNRDSRPFLLIKDGKEVE